MKLIGFLRQHYILLFILVLGTFLRLYHLDFQSIWIDEIHTMKEADPGLTWKEFDAIIMFREGIPHFYFMFVRLFFLIFGYTIWSARFLSVIAGICSIYGIYLLGRELYNKKAGLAAAALLAINSFHIYYSQEARSYSLLMAFTVFSFYFLLKFVRIPNLKYALLFGFFSGMITHAHPVGVTVIIGEYLIILFALTTIVKVERKRFFLLSLASGVLALVVFYPVYQIIAKVSDMTSFWVPQPTPDVYTRLVLEMLGNSEMTLFLFQLLFLYFVVSLFKQRMQGHSWKEILDTKLVLAFLVLVSWASVGFLIPLIRSYLLVPMIVNRYFINILPVFLLISGISVALIRTKLVQVILIMAIVFLSLTDLFVVRKYYTTVTKTEFREITADVLKRNKKGHKVYSAYGWLLSYFLDAGKSQPETVEITLENLVASMRNKAIPTHSFWYVDGSLRPYSLNPDDEKFLVDNFSITSSLARHDTWAKHYVAKNEPVFDGNFILATFSSANFDGAGNLMMFETGSIKSPVFKLSQGNYDLVIKGNSLPEKPVNGENAHLNIILGGKPVGQTYLSEIKNTPEIKIPLEVSQNENVSLELQFDNDFSEGKQDRNVILYSVKLIKK